MRIGENACRQAVRVLCAAAVLAALAAALAMPAAFTAYAQQSEAAGANDAAALAEALDGADALASQGDVIAAESVPTVTKTVAGRSYGVDIVIAGNPGEAAPAAASIEIAITGARCAVVSTDAASGAAGLKEAQSSIGSDGTSVLVSYFGNQGSAAKTFDSSGRIVVARLTLTSPTVGKAEIAVDYANSLFAKTGSLTEYGFAAGSCASVEIMEGYVKRLYREILLNPNPSHSQLDYWSEQMASGTSVVDVVKGFLDSKAFSEAGYTDVQKVKVLYAAMLGQYNPTDEQVSYWAERLAGGYNIHALAEGFARSDAFAAQCEIYGFDPSFTPDSDPSALVRRLYADVLLQGEPTPYQLDYWADAIYSGTSVVDVIKGFFDSDAYAKAGYTPEQQARIVYKAVLGQDDPSADQVTYWSDRISAGYSAHKVIEGFADSAAFRKMCATYGLDPSFESEFTPRDYVARLYKDILKNDNPTYYQLTYWSEELESGVGALGVVDGFLVSDAFAKAGYTNEQKVRVLYAAMLGNYNPTEQQLSWWVGKLDAGDSIHDVSAGFASSQAFAAECRIYGILAKAAE